MIENSKKEKANPNKKPYKLLTIYESKQKTKKLFENFLSTSNFFIFTLNFKFSYRNCTGFTLFGKTNLL